MCWRPATLLKETPRQVFPCKFCEIFKKTLFCRTLRWLLLFFVNPYLPQLLTNSDTFVWRFMQIGHKFSGLVLPIHHLHVQSQQWKHQNNVWNLFKVNNKDYRTTSLTTERRHIFHTLFWCYHCWLWTSECHLGSLILRLFEPSTRHNDGIFN